MALKKVLKKTLKNGPKPIADLITELSSSEDAIRGVISKNSAKFSINGDGLVSLGDITPAQSPSVSPTPTPEKRKADEMTKTEESPTVSDNSIIYKQSCCRTVGWLLDKIIVVQFTAV